MAFRKTMGVTILANNQSYHSINDFGLAIQNTDYLGTPVQDQNNYIFVPGRSDPLDTVDATFGGQYFMYRPIIIIFGGIEDPDEWDAVVSNMRNLFEGRKVSLIFDNDVNWYWQGRCSIVAFEHKRALGTFEFHIDYADAYKHRFKTTDYTLASGTNTITITGTRETVRPNINTNKAITITKNGVSESFAAGYNANARKIAITEGTNTLTVTATATTSLTISYTEGAL